MRILLFDVFGTLVDWRSSLIAIGEATGAAAGVGADWPAVIDGWRRAYQPAMDQIRAGAAWRDLDAVQAQTLDDVLARHDVALPGAGRAALLAGWRQLAPWPDTRDGLARLRAGHLTATLSNGHLALLADLLKFADLRVDVVLSAQLAGSYKPDPQTYLTALRLLDCPPSEAALVAAHPGDLRAAAALGLRPVFIRRPLEWGPAAAPARTPDLPGLIEAGRLGELADLLAG